MKYSIWFLLLLIPGGISISAQNQQASPPPGGKKVMVAGGGASSSSPRGDNTRSFYDLGTLDIKQINVNDLEASRRRLEETIYRSPTKEEIRPLNPSAYLLEKYASFLRQDDTGIVKLNSNAECGINPNVIVAKENCLQNPIPGGGSAYSFRMENYRLPQLADLILLKDVLKTDGVFQQGIMVRVGDVPLENLALETAGLKYLFDFKPAENLADLRQNDAKFSKGVQDGGFLYRMGFFVDEKTTFALRSIAYKGKVERSVSGVKYNELDFDKRKDVIVAFRVVEKDAGGNITILWKILSRRNSPTLKGDHKK